MFEPCVKTEPDAMLDYKLFARGAIRLNQNGNNIMPQQSDW